MQSANLIAARATKKPSILGRIFGFVFGIIFDIVLVFAIVAILRIFIVSPFQVKGHSMDETLAENDFILVDQISYRFSQPARGDIIVFQPPSNRLYEQSGILCEIYKIKAKLFNEDETKACFVPEYFVKRIIGTPGDKVQIFGGKVFITSAGETTKTEISEDFLINENRGQTCLESCATSRDKSKEFEVPQNSFFVLGDNRTGSSDSRHWQKNGTATPFVPFENIRGKVRVVLWPLTDLKIFPREEIL